MQSQLVLAAQVETTPMELALKAWHHLLEALLQLAEALAVLVVVVALEDLAVVVVPEEF